MAKNPKRKYSPSGSKIPRTEYPVNYEKETPVWLVGRIDKVGPWGWHEIDGEFFRDEIIKKIQDFESMKMFEIKGRNNHIVKISSISKQAQNRLKQIQEHDLDELFSLRISGKKRIWGILSGNRFHFLWWDPEHEVCPSFKKHT